MLNWIWLGLILIAVVYGAFTGSLDLVRAAVFDSAKDSVTLVIGLTGGMMFMLGLMRVARDGGLLRWIALALAPLLRRLFPDVPPEHPAMGAMVMNMATNLLGLGNAATPFGLKAMVELGKLNPRPTVATDPMILFLAINTSAITLMAPTGTMMVRSAAGSNMPDAIWIPTLIATTCSTFCAISAYYLLRRLRPAAAAAPGDSAVAEIPAAAIAAAEAAEAAEDEALPAPPPPTPARRAAVVGILLALTVALAVHVVRGLADASAGDVARDVAKTWPIPLLVVALLLVGVWGRVRVYEAMVEGAKEGLEVALRILPYLLAILVAVGMFRASGALALVISVIDPVTGRLGFPAEALPMALLRPLSGSGAFGVMSEILTTHGPDTFVGLLTSTLQGSTETTFYVLTLYLGAAGVRDGRFALTACLIGDLGGAVGATAACHLFFG